MDARTHEWDWKPLGFVVLYVVLGILGLLVAPAPGFASVISPLAGLGLAMVLHGGPRFAPWIALSAFLVYVLKATPLPVPIAPAGLAALLAFGATLQALLGRSLLHYFQAWPLPFSQDTPRLRFALLAGPVTGAVQATWGCLVLQILGLISTQEVGKHFLLWWVGDILSGMIIPPLSRFLEVELRPWMKPTPEASNERSGVWAEPRILRQLQRLENEKARAEDDLLKANSRIHELDASLGERSAEVARWTTDWNDATSQLERLRRTLQEREVRIDELVAETGQIPPLHEELAHLRRTCETHLHDRMETLRLMEAKSAEHENALATLRSERETLEHHWQETQRELDAFRSRWQSESAAWELSLGEMRSQRDRHLEELLRLRAEHDGANQELSQLRDRLASTDRDRLDLRQRILELEQRLRDHEAVRQRLGELEGSESSLRQRIPEFENRLRELEPLRHRIVELEVAESSLRQKLADAEQWNRTLEPLRGQLAESDRIVGELRRRLRDLEELAGATPRQIRELEDANALLRSQLRHMEDQRISLQTRIAELERELSTSRDELATARSHAESLRQELEAVRPQIPTLSREKSDLAERVTALQVQLAELKRQAETLADEKMQALSRLSAGVATDLQKVFTNLGGDLDLQLAKTDLEARFASPMRQWRQWTKDGSKLLLRLRDFGHHQPTRGTEFDLSEWARNTIARLPEAKTRPIEIQATEPVPVVADASELAEALRHLLKNACEATPRGEPVHIRTGRAGAEAYFEVADTGPGMDAEAVRRCMDPFYSTKEKPGMGLALVWAIARRYGGRLTVESEPGQGTRVTVWLPSESHSATLPFAGPKRRLFKKGVA